MKGDSYLLTIHRQEGLKPLFVECKRVIREVEARYPAGAAQMVNLCQQRFRAAMPNIRSLAPIQLRHFVVEAKSASIRATPAGNQHQDRVIVQGGVSRVEIAVRCWQGIKVIYKGPQFIFDAAAFGILAPDIEDIACIAMTVQSVRQFYHCRFTFSPADIVHLGLIMHLREECWMRPAQYHWTVEFLLEL